MIPGSLSLGILALGATRGSFSVLFATRGRGGSPGTCSSSPSVSVRSSSSRTRPSSSNLTSPHCLFPVRFQVEPVHVEPGFADSLGKLLVAASVLAKAMSDQHGTPRFGRSGLRH